VSRQLPPRPNPEYLRKQAKALLEELRQQNPAAQLSDAQHALAHQYGFANWPLLMEQVTASATVSPEVRRAFAGRWIPDLPHSQLNPASPIVAAKIDIAIEGDSVRIAHLSVDGGGRQEHGVYLLLPDGEERDQGNGYRLSARWLAPRTLEFAARRNGEVVGRGSYEVSADGTRLTISGEGQRIVCLREGPLPSLRSG